MKDLSTSIQEHSATLRSRHPAVRECRVNIADRPSHLYECRRFNVRLDIALGGHEIVVNREHDDDPAAALDDAFAAAQPGAGRRAHAAHSGMRKAARTGAPAAAGR